MFIRVAAASPSLKRQWRQKRLWILLVGTALHGPLIVAILAALEGWLWLAVGALLVHLLLPLPGMFVVLALPARFVQATAPLLLRPWRLRLLAHGLSLAFALTVVLLFGVLRAG